MPILVSCNCGKKFRVADDLAGKRIRCIGCKEVVRVPGAEQTEFEHPAAPGPTAIVADVPPPQEPRTQASDQTDVLPLAKEDEPLAVEAVSEERSRRQRSREDNFDYGDDGDDDQPTPKRRKRRRRGTGFAGLPDEILGMDLYVFGLVVVASVALIGILLALVFPPFAFLTYLTGFALMLGGQVWFLVIAFRDEVLYGLMCLCVPFYSLIYLISNFEETQRPFFVGLLGGGIMCISMCVGGFGPGLGPGPGQPQRIIIRR